ncbi:MAG: hypothetical protein JXR53_12335 [Bacteroidales bacterium]|nr:hypothetical protein [Bacteroidales bacterium]
MYRQVGDSKENKPKTIGYSVAQKKNTGKKDLRFVDNRTEAKVQQILQDRVNYNSQVTPTAQLQALVKNSFPPIQNPIPKKENSISLSDNIKTGTENRYSNSMDNVKVLYNSDKRAQLNSNTFAHGNSPLQMITARPLRQVVPGLGNADSQIFSALGPVWTDPNIIALARAFHQNKGNCDANQWATISNYAAFTNNVANVIAFARIAGWTWAGIDPLTTAFVGGANGLTAAQWITVAGYMANDAHANTIAFCQLAGWTWAGIDPLTAAFVGGANGLTAAQWVTIAGHMANDAHANTIAFCQLVGWNFAAINPLSLAFVANPNALTVYEWIGIATLLGNNTDAGSIAFAQLANWTYYPVVAVVTAFLYGGNHNAFTAVQWTIIASQVQANNVRLAIQYAEGGDGRDIILTREDRFAEVYPNAIRIGSQGWQAQLNNAIGNVRENIANSAMRDQRHVGAQWPRADRISHWTQGGNGGGQTGFVAHVNNVSFFIAYGNHAGPNTYNLVWKAANVGGFIGNQVTI